VHIAAVHVVGGGELTVSTAHLLIPPPGGGVNTVIFLFPKNEANQLAVSFVELLNIVASSNAPLRYTLDDGIKLLPFTVIDTIFPSVAVVGEIEDSTG